MRTAEEALPLRLCWSQLQFDRTGDAAADSQTQDNLVNWRDQALAECEQIIERPPLGRIDYVPGWAGANDGLLCFQADLPQAVKKVHYWRPGDPWQRDPQGELTPTQFGLVYLSQESQRHTIAPPALGWPDRLGHCQDGLDYGQFIVAVEVGLADEEILALRQAALLLIADYFSGVSIENKAARAKLSGLCGSPLLALAPQGLAQWNGP